MGRDENTTKQRDIVARLRDWLGGRWAIDRNMDDDMAEAAIEIESLRDERDRSQAMLHNMILLYISGEGSGKPLETMQARAVAADKKMTEWLGMYGLHPQRCKEAFRRVHRARK